MKTTPVAPASSPEVGGSADDREPEVKEKPPKPPKEKSATWGQFLRYFTAMDWMLVSLAFVGELIAGVAQPAMLLVFNDVFKSLGAGSIIQGVVIPSGVLQRILVTMAYIGAAIGGGQWASGWAINHVTARQMVKYKTAYLKAVLRQDVGWYDTSNPEELTTKFAESMLKVTKALKSIPPIFNGLGYGFGGLVVALVPTLGNPEVAGVTLATVPILIIAASGMMYVMQTGGKKVSDAYAEAGGTVTECLFSMRTIAALGIQRAFIDRYAAALKKVRKTAIVNNALFMCGAGLALSAYLIMMAVAIIYGAWRLSGEIEKSQFPLVTTDPSTGLSVYHCATVDGLFSANSTMNPAGCEIPLKLSCAYADVLVTSGQGTTLLDYAGGDASAVPPGFANVTLLAAHGFASIASFNSYVTNPAIAPSSYLNDNADYYGCSIDGARIIIAIFAIMMMGEGFSMAGAPAQHVALGKQAAAKVIEVIERVPVIDSFSKDGATLPSVSGDLRVSDVTFAYPSAPEHTVCKGYSLTISAGQTVALCGPSGSGKSTIISLLERFYDPQSGAVLLDGVDIKTLNVRWLRAQFGLVSQEPVLFQGTVAQNIAYGMPQEAGTPAQQDIEDAARMANAHDFITQSLSDGYTTQVGQGGSKLSGGQKQRVAIARALIKKPPILLLDEATSALDNESERIVQAALDEIMAKQKRTTVVIAHRLSTIRGADKIAVLQEGTVHEEGTYNELMAIEGGLFRQLGEKQEKLLARDKQFISSGGDEVNATVVEGADGDAAYYESVNGVPVSEAEGKEPSQRDEEVAVPKRKGGPCCFGKPPPQKKAPPKEKAESAPLGRLFKMQADQSGSLVLMILFSGAACVLSTLSFYLMVEVMDVVFNSNPSQMRKDATHLATVLGVYAAVIIVSFTFSGVFNALAGTALTAKLRSRGVSALMRQEMAFFDLEENSATELTTFLAEKVDKVKTITAEQLDLFAQLAGGVISFLYVVARYSDWRLLLCWIGMVAIMGVVMPLQVAFISAEDAADTAKKKGVEDTSKVGKETASANRIVGDAVMGIRTVASFNLEQRFFDGYERSTQAISQVQKRDAIVGPFFLGFSSLVMYSTMGAIFFYSVWLANEGVVDFIKAMVPLMAIMGVIPPMMKASSLADLPSATKAAVRLFRLFDRVPAIDSLGEDGTKLGSVSGDLRVSDVTFAYPSAPEHTVCKGYSLTISAGQTVALCGPSGSGKSTIISLLERFYDPQSGAVLLDGVDIKTLNVRWLRAQFGLVSQEPVLFQGTVAQNIAYGMPQEAGTPAQQDIEDAARMANAHDFITQNLGSGYQTNVGLKGGKLSGGQKQRVAIARALIKKPPILLLDEATSALDNESESIVQAALDEIMTKQKRTTVVIAHRLSTIRGADKIAVVNEGRVIEEGTHDELLARPAGSGGMYANLILNA